MPSLSPSPAVTVEKPAIAATKVPASLSDYFDEPDGGAASGIIYIIHGRSKSGKTTLASTYSEYLTNGPCFLDDMLFLVCDNDGLGSLETRVDSGGQAAPIRAHTFNMLKLWRTLGFVKGQTALFTGLQKILTAHPQIRCLVVDSLTSVDVEANVKFVDEADESVDGYTRYRQVLGTHRQFHAWARKTGLDIIYNCHQKLQGESEGKAKKKQEAVKLVGGGEIIPALTGGALSIYQRDMSFQGAIMTKTDPRSPKDRSYSLVTAEMNGIEAGSRYSHLFNPEEPCNLRAIRMKIDGARQGARAAQGEKK